ncbi:MAG TPA: hypothetical protein VIL85_08305 [Thermomicrobiales bacterium]
MGSARTGQSAGTTAGQAKEQVQQAAADVKEQVQQTAAGVKEQVAAQATDKLASQKDVATGSLNSVAHAFRQTGEQLRDNDQAGIANYVERAAGQVEHFAGYLSKRDLRELAQDTEQFARREPALFLGGAFALGLFAARFLKSSSQVAQVGAQGNRQNWQGQADWYGQQPSPAIAPPPQLPAHTASVGTGSGVGSSAAQGGSGTNASQAGMATSSATTGIGSTAGRGTPTPGTGSTAGRGTPTTASMGGTSGGSSMGTQPSDDVIVGGPPLPTDVIVGGPPREPGRGGR